MQCARDAGARPVLGVQPRLRLARLARRGPLRLPQGLGCLLPRGGRLERLFFLCLCLLGRSRRLPLRFLRVHGLLLLARLRSLRLLWRVRLGRRRHRDGSGHSCGRGRGRGRLGHCSDRWSRDRRRLCRRRGGHRRLGGCSCRRLGSGSGSGGCSGRWLGGRRRHGCYWRRLRHSCHRYSWLRHSCYRDGLGRCHGAVAGGGAWRRGPAPTLAFELRPRWGGQFQRTQNCLCGLGTVRGRN